jgi:hypothetical protein
VGLASEIVPVAGVAARSEAAEKRKKRKTAATPAAGKETRRRRKAFIDSAPFEFTIAVTIGLGERRTNEGWASIPRGGFPQEICDL